MDIEQQRAVAQQILATARTLIERPHTWTRKHPQACTARGEPCEATDARAVRWGARGAFYRATSVVAQTAGVDVIPGALLALHVLARAIPACACTERTFRAEHVNALGVYAYAIEMLQRLTYADVEYLMRLHY
jgi:hypothetical protein